MEKELNLSKDQKLHIRLESEVAKKRDKDGKIIEDISPNGEKQYLRNDAMGLQRLLSRFDTRKHQIREWKSWTSIKNKLYQCYLHDEDTLSLTKDEAGFLKDYLENLPEKEGKEAPLAEFEAKTYMGVLEVLRNNS